MDSASSCGQWLGLWNCEVRWKVGLGRFDGIVSVPLVAVEADIFSNVGCRIVG